MKYIVPLSGKDSVALAWFLRQQYPERKFLYPGTPVVDREPPELLFWLLEAARRCGGEYLRVNSRGFEDWLQHYGGYLPSAHARWCTRKLKIEPMEEWLKGLDEECTVYLGLRADEDRDGNTGEVKGLHYEYPFIDQDKGEEDVLRLVADLFGVSVPDGLTGGDLWRHLIDHQALPEFYRWMTHANCVGCIFWRIDQWRDFYFRDPDWYWRIAAQEDEGSHFTYKQGWTLAQLAQRFQLEAAGFKMGPRRKGQSQLALDLAQPLPEDDPWLKPCAACRIGG